MSNRTFNEEGYLDLLHQALTQGIPREDRTGTGTRSLFGYKLRFDIENQFPLLTTKKMAMKSVMSELLWFLEGSGDERRLAEIHYGKPRSELNDKKTIWTANATAPYWQPKARHEGDLGRVYGVQWRDWQSPVRSSIAGLSGEVVHGFKRVDQLKNLMEGLVKEPTSRRHILMAYNPGELDDMALPPCHCLTQFYVDNDGGLSCQMYQRSADLFLGAPFNIASYSALTYMIASVLGLKPREFIYVIGDAHIYNDHIMQVEEQLTRSPHPAPALKVEKVGDILDYTMKSVEVMDYTSEPAIPAPMAI